MSQPPCAAGIVSLSISFLSFWNRFLDDWNLDERLSNFGLVIIRTSPSESAAVCRGHCLVHFMKDATWVTDEPTWRCHQNPFIGALGIQEPVIPGEPLIKRQPMKRYTDILQLFFVFKRILSRHYFSLLGCPRMNSCRERKWNTKKHTKIMFESDPILYWVLIVCKQWKVKKEMPKRK